MRIIALIEGPGVIRRILEHLGPANVVITLTYHPVPYIA
jgi:hypothetical protein